MKAGLLGRLQAIRAAGEPVALVTDLGTGLQTLVTAATVEGGFGFDSDPRGLDLLGQVRARLRADRSGRIEAEDPALFVRVFNPNLRLFLVGAVHIAQALAPMAALAGYAVTVIDPRGAFATGARFPDTRLIQAWPDEALAGLIPDRRSAVVTLTHDPKLDDPALTVGLRSPAFYIGALGSRKTHGRRVERLSAQGFGPEDIARIQAPVGLALGAVSPAEIAVSVLAQMIAVLRGASAGGG
jgi:xanthine dehydrogenase accessory factor